jgi:hypothetical protein
VIERCQHHDHRPRQPRSAAGALSRVRLGTTCRRSPPGSARRWRRRRFVAGFTDREDEGPTELPVIEHCQHPDSTTTGHGTPDRQPVRCLAFALAHWSAIATRHRSTLAPSSLRGRLDRSIGRRTDRTADGRALPAPRHHDHRPRQPRSAAGTLSRLRHQAALDAGAVVASWRASPIEKTKDRPNCRWSSAASTPTSRPQATATPIGSRYAVPRSPWPTGRRSPPGSARRWRRRRFVAGFTDREDEGPTELPVIEHCQHPDSTATGHGTPDRPRFLWLSQLIGCPNDWNGPPNHGTKCPTCPNQKGMCPTPSGTAKNIQ